MIVAILPMIIKKYDGSKYVAAGSAEKNWRDKRMYYRPGWA